METFQLPMDRRKSVAVLSKPAKPELAKILPELLAWFEKHNYSVMVDKETIVYTKWSEVVARTEMASRSLDLVVVLGGDGTLLSAARAVARAGVPVLGVNLGSLGFLTEVPLAELYPTLDAMERGACGLESRSMVNCELHRAGACVSTYQALNDVVVSKSAIARLNNFDLFIDKSFVSNYKADGLIVSTPTGSTAYSLAAAGPILMPNVDAFVITPVSPHSLTHRALVVRDTAEIEIVVRTGDEEAYLSVDGQVGMPVHDGDRVACQKAKHGVKLVRRSNTFFDVLRTKLKWGQR
jgi:NAD+ kinase